MEDIVSIVLPTYNSEHTIADTINSIQKQSFEMYKCIIVDDYSDDNTVQVASQLVGQDNRFSIIEC